MKWQEDKAFMWDLAVINVHQFEAGDLQWQIDSKYYAANCLRVTFALNSFSGWMHMLYRAATQLWQQKSAPVCTSDCSGPPWPIIPKKSLSKGAMPQILSRF